MQTGRHNYYEILELPTNAAQHEITTAYERARLTYCGDNPAIYTIFSENEARELLVMIEEAYSVLGNKTLRTIYDQRLFGGQSVPQELSFDSILTASKAMLPEPKPEEKKPTYQIDENMERLIQDTSDWSGDLLKQVREYKKLALDKLAERTKIKSWYLKAIENMDGSNLPAPVFVRGYVMQLAKELGLNEKAVADSYMKTFKSKPGH